MTLPLPAHRYEKRQQQPPDFGPGEACAWCSYYAAGMCTLFHVPMDGSEWCSQYEATAAHTQAFARKPQLPEGGP